MKDKKIHKWILKLIDKRYFGTSTGLLRYITFNLRVKGYSYRRIAEGLNRHPSTVYEYMMKTLCLISNEIQQQNKYSVKEVKDFLDKHNINSDSFLFFD